MNDVEQFLQIDRAVGIPEVPDLFYTEAVVRRRLRQMPGESRRSAIDWGLMIAALALVTPIFALLVHFGRSPGWLLAFPLALLVLSPILLAKEHGHP